MTEKAHYTDRVATALRTTTFQFSFQIVVCQRLLSCTGVTPETLTKVMIVQSQLIRRGAQPKHVAEVMKTAIGER